MDTSNYQQFVKEFKQLTKIDLNKYKDTQMVRRIENFVRNNELRDFSELSQLIKKNALLLETLKSHITINVTEFMRNKNMWDDFCNLAVPTVSSDKKKIKLWSAACSSGEEPYTIAILLKEKFPMLDFEIIATDLDEEILTKAKDGRYKKRDVKAFDTKTLCKYFDEVGDSLIVKDELKRKVTFKKHNLLEDAFPKGIDLIICRNVLIYFKEEEKNIIFDKFAKSLLSNGILFIGATEQIFKPEHFDLKLMKSFFYQKQ